MKISLSVGNGKIGMRNIKAFSFSPIIFCDKRFPCTKGDCYILHRGSSYVNFPNVRECWDRQSQNYIQDPERFCKAFLEEVSRKRVEFFRYFVSGDCPDFLFAETMVRTARENPNMKFLAFTKKYDIFLPFRKEIPENLVVRFSVWSGMDYPESWNWHSWISIDSRIPKNGFRCREKCEPCGRVCWNPKVHNIILPFKKDEGKERKK